MKIFTHTDRYIYHFVTLIVMVITAACSPEDELAMPRMFMPGGDIRITSGERDVLIAWDAALMTTGKTVTYTVEVSDDTLFATTAFTFKTDTTAIVLTDNQLPIKKSFFARIKTDGINGAPDSKWRTSSSFAIKGEQLFLPLRTGDVKAISVLLRWVMASGITKMTLTAQDADVIEIPVSIQEDTNGEKQLKELQPNTVYTAEIFKEDKSKGTITFRTEALTNFGIVLSATDNLAFVLDTCASNTVIGLNPGVYDVKDQSGTYVNLVIRQKMVTIRAISDDPADTHVNFKEITLKGDLAGVKLSGIDFDGSAAGAAYFLNLTGLSSDADPASFQDIEIDNCRIRNTTNCLFRGNRAANNAHKIGRIKIHNTIAGNNGGSYTYFTMEKLDFSALEITNSTFYNIGRSFIGWSTNLTGNTRPTVLIDGCTFNNFGSDNRNNIVLDANANPITFTMQNCIIGNIPKPGGTVGTSLLRATSDASQLTYSYNNMFKMTNGAGSALVLPSYAYLSTGNNINIDPGWDASTTVFTLPANSVLRTAGKTGGPIGDPRWAY